MLRRCILVLAAIGLGATALPFVASLRPNAKADAALTRIEISDLAPGRARVLVLEEPYWGGMRRGVLLVHRADGRRQAWDVPMHEGRVLMPSFQHWFGALWPCTSFGPTLLDGAIDEAAPITCHDADLPRQRAEASRWTLDGESLGVVENLVPAVGKFEGAYFVVGKRS